MFDKKMVRIACLLLLCGANHASRVHALDNGLAKTPPVYTLHSGCYIVKAVQGKVEQEVKVSARKYCTILYMSR